MFPTHPRGSGEHRYSICFQGYFADRRAALTSEDGGIGMQAAIITGGFVAIALAIGLILRNTANDVGTSLDSMTVSTADTRPRQ